MALCIPTAFTSKAMLGILQLPLVFSLSTWLVASQFLHCRFLVGRVQHCEINIKAKQYPPLLTPCVSYYCDTVIKYHSQRNLRRKQFAFTVLEGWSPSWRHRRGLKSRKLANWTRGWEVKWEVNGVRLSILKAQPQWPTSFLLKVPFLKQHQLLGINCSSTWVSGRHFSFKLLHSLISILMINIWFVYVSFQSLDIY